MFPGMSQWPCEIHCFLFLCFGTMSFHREFLVFHVSLTGLSSLGLLGLKKGPVHREYETMDESKCKTYVFRWKYNEIYYSNVRPPFDSVQLVQITPFCHYGSWYSNNELVTGANLNQHTYLKGASHCMIPSGNLT